MGVIHFHAPQSSGDPVPRRTFLGGTAALFLSPLLGRVAFAGDAAKFVPADFISVQKGDLPIIFSAPHGGMMDIPGVPERKGEGMKTGGAGFFAGRDANTELLAPAIAAAIQKRLGKKPYFVIAKMHRKYVDPNRPPEIAVEHPRAREVYDAYRGQLVAFCDDVQKRFGRGLLLDIHGQGSAKDTVFRGTHNGTTVSNLTKMLGDKIHAGPQSLAGLLVARGIQMKPTDTSPETSGFTGGDIVRVSGGHVGIGAVQCEFGADFRAKDAIPAVAEKFADAVVDFARLYLLEKADGKK